MITRKHITYEFIFLIGIGAAIGLFLVQALHSRQQFISSASFSSQTQQPTDTPMPTPTFTPTTTSVSQISSDGTKKLTMNIISNEDASHRYQLYTVDNSAIIFSQTLSAGESMDIPFNTWSADNKYFFIEEHKKTGISVLVFTASGAPFADGESSLDLTGTFRDKIGNTFDQATGWAEDDLIVINTKLTDGTQGPSYWFTVPGKAIIQLSTKF